MSMSAMVWTDISWKERWNVLFNEAKPNIIQHFISHLMKMSVLYHTNENIHYKFVLFIIKSNFLSFIKLNLYILGDGFSYFIAQWFPRSKVIALTFQFWQWLFYGINAWRYVGSIVKISCDHWIKWQDST